MNRNLLKIASALILSALIGCGAVRHGATANADLLSFYRDRSRVLLIFAPAATKPSYREQQLLLSAAPRGGEGVRLRAHYSIGPAEFRVLLIGNDGHVAFASGSLVEARGLFSATDIMPMRRQEMRREYR